MINILFYIEDDIEYCKNIVNNLSKINNNIRICRILNHIEELSNIDNLCAIDVYIFFISNTTNKTLLNIIQNSFNFKSVIVISENILNFSNTNIHYILKNKNITSDIRLLNDIINRKKDVPSIKEKIENELSILGYDPIYIGTKYLLEAIYLLYNYNPTTVVLEKDIYPIIAQRHKKTVHNIKNNIMNSTNYMYYNNDHKKIDSYLKTPFKPSPKKVMSMVVYNLKRSNIREKIS